MWPNVAQGVLYFTGTHIHTVGTSVALYGTIAVNTPPATPVTAKFVLDNGAPVLYTAPLVSNRTQQQQEYSSGPIPDGQHKLVIAHTSNSLVTNGVVTNRFVIDYFLITVRTAQI